jgi:undecaprenyl-diphosphatase
MVKDILDGAFETIGGSMVNYGVGFIAAFVTGIIACTWMIKLVKKSKLKYFAFYCFIVGAIAIVYSLV